MLALLLLEEGLFLWFVAQMNDVLDEGVGSDDDSGNDQDHEVPLLLEKVLAEF